MILGKELYMVAQLDDKYIGAALRKFGQILIMLLSRRLIMLILFPEQVEKY